MKKPAPPPRFFATPANFRAWLLTHHETETELWVGFYRKASGRPSITWPESVGEALCVGWIDGLRKTVDDSSYMIRFTPRKPTSFWSEVNLGRVEELTRQGRMRPAGLAAFKRRIEEKSGVYSYEQRKRAALDLRSVRRFQANRKAWQFFQAQSPAYQKMAAWWVISAKREETRQKRLEKLIEESKQGRRLL